VIHVGLNLVFCVPGETGGMEVAARETIPHLAATPDLRLTAFVNREAAGTFAGVDEVVVPVRARNRVQWVRGEQQHLPPLAARAGCDVVHSLGSTAPLWGRFRRVTTIHDLNYRMAPEAHFGLLGLGMRVLVPAAARRSHRVLVDAASTRDDLVAHLGVAAERIDVVPLGVSPPAVAPTPEAELRLRLGLGERPVLLCVGARRPHKNAVAVIGTLPALEPRPVLVVTGYRTPYEDELRAWAAALGVGEDLRLPERSSAADLEGLYALARAVVVPSLYEGFGLPVLEAMARGVPVACSNRASLPEVAGDAALVFDPADGRAVRDAVAALLRDDDLVARLVAAGRARAATFTWARTAELTAAAYRRVVAPAR
jgi:glycosyltransferase involved in cell wall biosynthesis